MNETQHFLQNVHMRSHSVRRPDGLMLKVHTDTNVSLLLTATSLPLQEGF